MKTLTKCLLALLGISTATGAYADETTWQSFSAGSFSTYAIKSDGTLWAWGSGEQGELGDGNAANNWKVTTPIQVGEDNDWATVVGGSSRFYAIKKSGELYSAGTGDNGALGTGATSTQSTLTMVGTTNDWASVASSIQSDNYNALAIKDNGELWGWGRNPGGEIGVGDYSQHATPVQAGDDTDWVQVSMGREHSLGLKQDGTIWATGGASSYRTDLCADVNYSNKWIKIAEADNWTAVYAIESSSYAIKSDGTLWAWGKNGYDLLGLNTGDTSETETVVTNPTQVTALQGVLKIAGSQYVRVAISDTNADGIADEVYTWGYNYCGVIGNGTGVAFGDRDNLEFYTTPQKVTLPDGVTGITDVSTGETFVVVLTDDGKLFGWGANDWGQLGNGAGASGVYSDTPVEVGAGAAEVDPGAEFDAANIPTSLSGIEKITLTGEWGTEDFQNLIPAIGNTTGINGYLYNTTLLTVDMSAVTFKEGTELTNTFRNCTALATVIMPTNESTANLVSLNNAFLNDNALSTIDISQLVNVTDLTQAFQNCKLLTTFDLSKWAGVTESEMAFQNCDALAAIVLPGQFEIGDRCFGADYALKLIDWSKYEGTTCPRGSDEDNGYSPFYGVDFLAADKAGITIMVPTAAYASFSNDSYWGGFNIVEAAGSDTYTFVSADAIPESLADATKIMLTGLWDTEKFAELAAALGTASSITASNSTLITIDMSQAEIAEGTELTMQVASFIGSTDKGVFQNLTALENVIMPAADQAANFTSFKQAFQGCSSLTAIDLSGCTGVTTSASAFYNCTSLTTVILPGSFPLNSEAFDRCTALSTIDWSRYEGTEAPTYSASALPSLDTPKSLTVIVPIAAYDAFMASSAWNSFTIVATGTSGIDSIRTAGADDTARPVYNLYGQHVTTLAPGENESKLPAGIYIIAGKKVLVK